MPRALPFPSILAASRDDPWIAFGRARRLARIWKSRFVDAGWLGHINADSGIRDWPFGQFLLRQLKRRGRAAQPAAAARAELCDADRAAGGCRGGVVTQRPGLRHSRESGNPGRLQRCAALGPRFRGDDERWAWRSGIGGPRSSA